jgi:hypothetical protein
MKETPRVYADFNRIEYSKDSESPDSLKITGYGTLASLSRQKIQLEEGMELTLITPNDIECEVIVKFNEKIFCPSGAMGAWVAYFNHNDIRDCIGLEVEEFGHPCFNCGVNLEPHFKLVGRSYKESCPICGVNVMAPMAKPEKAS